MTSGWICPKCQSVYGPAAQECPRCNAGTDILPLVKPLRAQDSYPLYHPCPLCGMYHPGGATCPFTFSSSGWLDEC